MAHRESAVRIALTKILLETSSAQVKMNAKYSAVTTGLQRHGGGAGEDEVAELAHSYVVVVDRAHCGCVALRRSSDAQRALGLERSVSLCEKRLQLPSGGRRRGNQLPWCDMHRADAARGEREGLGKVKR